MLRLCNIGNPSDMKYRDEVEMVKRELADAFREMDARKGVYVVSSQDKQIK